MVALPEVSATVVAAATARALPKASCVWRLVGAEQFPAINVCAAVTKARRARAAGLMV